MTKSLHGQGVSGNLTPATRRWPIVAVVMLALPVLYVASEAPLVRLTGQTPHGGLWCVYKPVDWLFDETPAFRLLLAWYRLWDVEVQMSRAFEARVGFPWGH
jgi:hypothetical protein